MEDGIAASVASWMSKDGEGLVHRGTRNVGSYVSPRITILRFGGHASRTM